MSGRAEEVEFCAGAGRGRLQSGGPVSSLGLSTPLAELQASEGLFQAGSSYTYVRKC